MRHAEIRRSLYDFVRGELDAAQAKAIDEHLARCNRCFAECQIVKEALRLVPVPSGSPSSERSPEFWNRFASTVDAKARIVKKSAVTTNPVFEGIPALITYRRPLVAAFAGAAIVVVVSLVIWSSGVMQQPTVESYSQVVRDVEADPVRVELANYYRKSKMLLVGISNIEPESGQRIDLTVEKTAARRLVQQARYLDSDALDERSRALVRALERILIELANMEQQSDVPDVEIVRTGIRSENMLFKIRMAETDFTSPQKNGTRVEN